SGPRATCAPYMGRHPAGRGRARALRVAAPAPPLAPTGIVRSGRLREVVAGRLRRFDAERSRRPSFALDARDADRDHEDRQLECPEQDRQRYEERVHGLSPPFTSLVATEVPPLTTATHRQNGTRDDARM